MVEMTEKTMSKQPRSCQHLKPYQFKKGVSGNPNGRPKGSGISITTEIKKKLEECPEGQKATYLQLLINRILKQAIQDGDQKMITKIWNYVDGLPKQNIDHTTGGKDLKGLIQINYVKEKDSSIEVADDGSSRSS